MLKYIWQQAAWPIIKYPGLDQILPRLSECRRLQGQLEARVKEIHGDLVREAEYKILSSEAIDTSLIEGVDVNPDSIRSSVAKRLGMPWGGLPEPTKHDDGLVDMLLDATHNSDAPLTAERLFGWHAGLFPTGHSGLRKIAVATWRDPTRDPMQVVSGPDHRPKVHYEAPPAGRVPEEMDAFLKWFDASQGKEDGLARAATAHLWFVTIHPFEDGNGRIARAITDLALAQDDRAPVRLYCMSHQIHSVPQEKQDYYSVLEKTQKGTGEADKWLAWFAGCLERSLLRSLDVIRDTLAKANFWKAYSEREFNDRQLKVLKRLVELGPEGFEGKLTNKKYKAMTKASHATAARDLQDLVRRGVLVQGPEGGRSTRYDLDWEGLSQGS